METTEIDVSLLDRPSASSVACVIAERRYFHGAAALANSLIHGGFRGQIVVGYRGVLPGWAATIHNNRVLAQVAPGVILRFVPVGPAPDGTDWHLSNVKPFFLRKVATEHCPDFDVLYFFDADIVIQCAWQHYWRWAQYGVVLAQDMAETAMPTNHAYRHEWRALAMRAGFTCRDIAGYFNGGFLGLSQQNITLLDVWAQLMEHYAGEGADMTSMTAHGGRPEFIRMDQDILNIALMATRFELAVLGREAMGCFPDQRIMQHAMVFAKPWQRNYLLDALKGFPPDNAHRAFWRHTNGPVQSFTPNELRTKRLQVRLARWIGLVRRRAVADW
jgi:hypothetical protein